MQAFTAIISGTPRPVVPAMVSKEAMWPMSPGKQQRRCKHRAPLPEPDGILPSPLSGSCPRAEDIPSCRGSPMIYGWAPPTNFGQQRRTGALARHRQAIRTPFLISPALPKGLSLILTLRLAAWILIWATPAPLHRPIPISQSPEIITKAMPM